MPRPAPLGVKISGTGRSVPQRRLDNQFFVDRLDTTDAWIRDTLKPLVDSLPGLRSVLGKDFGRSGDLSVDVVLQEQARGK
mgnify:CR=1 FL=1